MNAIDVVCKPNSKISFRTWWCTPKINSRWISAIKLECPLLNKLTMKFLNINNNNTSTTTKSSNKCNNLNNNNINNNTWWIIPQVNYTLNNNLLSLFWSKTVLREVCPIRKTRSLLWVFLRQVCKWQEMEEMQWDHKVKVINIVVSKIFLDSIILWTIIIVVRIWIRMLPLTWIKIYKRSALMLTLPSSFILTKQTITQILKI